MVSSTPAPVHSQNNLADKLLFSSTYSQGLVTYFEKNIWDTWINSQKKKWKPQIDHERPDFKQKFAGIALSVPWPVDRF